MKKFTPIAMKCTQEQFNKLKPYLDKYGLKCGDIEDFSTTPYLINNRYNEVNNITNYTKSNCSRIIHEIFNLQTFLNACGVELETFEITKTQIKELHEIGNEQTKSKLKELFSEVLDNELEVGEYYNVFFEEDLKDHYAIIKVRDTIKDKVCFDYGVMFYSEHTEWSEKDWFRDSLIYVKATTEEITEALKNEAVKRDLTPENLESIECLDGYDKSSAYKIYKDEIGKFKFEIHNNKLLIVDGSSLSICVFKNGKWATPIKTITIKEAEEMLKMKIVG